MTEPLLVATRKSPLAMKQAELTVSWLREKMPDTEFELLPLATKVDQRLQWSLEQRGGIGLFTKELEEALHDRRAALAVHSAKDLPTSFDARLAIAGHLPRARPNDILVLRKGRGSPASIASSSPRRRAQVELLYPDAEWTTIRGNVATRLRKTAEGAADATLLAAAGLDRLGIREHEGLSFTELTLEQVVPAPGQAAIAIQCREEDRPRFSEHFCAVTTRAVSLERTFLRLLGGGCQTPVGAHYDQENLLIYHPETGHRSFYLPLPVEASADEIEEAVAEILRDLSLIPRKDSADNN